MSFQRVFPVMQKLRPPRPTIRSESVARRVAERIVDVVNDEGLHWDDHELPDITAAIQFEIERVGRPATVIDRLWRRQPPISCSGEKPTHPWGWEGIDKDCRYCADKIAQQELAAANERYDKRYIEVTQ